MRHCCVLSRNRHVNFQLAALMALPISAAPAGRQAFVHDGQTVYEWEQNLNDVLVYIRPPPGIKASMLACKIDSGHISLGIKGNPPFINVRGFWGCARSLSGMFEPSFGYDFETHVACTPNVLRSARLPTILLHRCAVIV